MSPHSLEIAVPTSVQYRNFPVSMFAENAKALAASGHVDYLQTWDQLMGWWPPSLWTPDNTPLAALMPDPDAYADVFALLAYGCAHAPELGVMVSSDAIRRGPAELTQTMLTLANMTGGRAMLHLGAGEVKQTRPFGWKRSQGLSRLQEQFEIFHRFWNSPEPFSYDGQYTVLKNAWLGRPHDPQRPQLWALGGGPKLIEIAAQYADGFAFVIPGVFPTPEEFSATRDEILEAVEVAGRDPAEFRFGIYAMTAIHEDPEVIERSLENPVMKWMTAIWGRLAMGDWAKVGLEPPFPVDWHYAMKLLPLEISESEAQAVLSRVTAEHGHHGWITGDAEEVATQIRAFVDVGVTWAGLFDFLPLVLPLEEAQSALGRTLEVARLLKSC